MKKFTKNFIAFICTLAILLNGFSAFAAGYEVIMEPTIDAIDGKDTFGDEYKYEQNLLFYPTPFNKGFSVVHRNVMTLPGEFVQFLDKESYIVDMYGNKIDVGNYDCFGTYGSGGEKYFREYNLPFNTTLGVDNSGYIIVYKNGKCGLIDTQGNVIIPCEYDNLYDAPNIFDILGMSAAESEKYEGKYELPFDNSIEPLLGYHYLYLEHESYEQTRYYNGLAVVRNGYDEASKIGIVDKNDNIIVPFEYDMITPCYDKICWVLKDGKWGTISVNNDPINVTINEETVIFDQIPLAINGRTLAPLRAIFEKLGATVDWNNETQTVTSTKYGTVITMTLGNDIMTKNGEEIVLEEAPRAINGRTLVPVRAIAEAFGCDVNWDGETKTVKITK